MVNYEPTRNEVFERALSYLLKDADFIVGTIQLPQAHRFSYSTYGTSIPDFCVIRENYYKESDKTVTAGVVVSDDSWRLARATEIIDVESMHLAEHFLGTGVVEFKRDKYELDQTAKEMMKVAGDIVAKALIKGLIVNCVQVYFNTYFDSTTGWLLYLTAYF